MNAMWWAVVGVGRPELVLVVENRVAVSTALSLVEVGEPWGPARERLEKIGFKCVMRPA